MVWCTMHVILLWLFYCRAVHSFYVLSLLDRDANDDLVIRHYRIRRLDNGGFCIQTGMTFSDLFGLISFSSGLSIRLSVQLSVYPKLSLSLSLSLCLCLSLSLRLSLSMSVSVSMSLYVCVSLSVVLSCVCHSIS